MLRKLESINQYELVRCIAQGGMGAVYQAKQIGPEGFEKNVAIKTILPKYSSSEQFIRMFIGEAKLVANLVHENIVQIYQLGKSDESYYIAMEYVEGINLKQFIEAHRKQHKPLPFDLGAFIISRVCRGLDYAHRKRDSEGNILGVVHRDVSPKNILMDYQGVVKIADFGIAKARRLLYQDEGSLLVGKFAYMSPEQASFLETDRRSDIFSLGAVMFELLAGRKMFDRLEIEEILSAVKSGRIPQLRDLRPEIPGDLDDICLKALARSRDDRYQWAGEMGHALEYYMYHDRYGPTNEKLARYLREMLGPSEPEPATPSTADDQLETGSRIFEI